MRWLYIGVVFGCVVFRQFWQGQLPAPVASILSKLFYWPFMPITVYTSTCIRNWWDEVIPESQVYIGAVPLPWMGHIDMLDKQLSIVAVVNMMVEDRGPVEEYTLRNITQLHLPTPDHMEPSLKDIEQGVEFIKQHSVMLHSEKDKANIEKDYEGNRRGEELWQDGYTVDPTYVYSTKNSRRNDVRAEASI
eukprot:CFRG3361T1